MLQREFLGVIKLISDYATAMDFSILSKISGFMGAAEASTAPKPPSALRARGSSTKSSATTDAATPAPAPVPVPQPPQPRPHNTVLCFSKDRPFQLSQLLWSLRTQVQVWLC